MKLIQKPMKSNTLWKIGHYSHSSIDDFANTHFNRLSASKWLIRLTRDSNITSLEFKHWFETSFVSKKTRIECKKICCELIKNYRLSHKSLFFVHWISPYFSCLSRSHYLHRTSAKEWDWIENSYGNSDAFRLYMSDMLLSIVINNERLDFNRGVNRELYQKLIWNINSLKIYVQTRLNFFNLLTKQYIFGLGYPSYDPCHCWILTAMLELLLRCK